MKRVGLLLAAVALLSVACGRGDDQIVVAAGTTLVDSGAAATLAAAYEQESGVGLSIVGASSQEALVLLAAGEAGVAITHSPDIEAAFASENPQYHAVPVFSSSFVLAGPAALADGVRLVPIPVAFSVIHDEGLPFVSRDDGSGTAAKEAEVWDVAERDPFGRDWHIVTGEGMGTTLQIADQRDAFVLAELGALLASKNVSLTVIDSGPGTVDMLNRYTAWNGDPDNPRLAALVDWLRARGPDVLESYATAAWGQPVYSES